MSDRIIYLVENKRLRTRKGKEIVVAAFEDKAEADARVSLGKRGEKVNRLVAFDCEEPFVSENGFLKVWVCEVFLANPEFYKKGIIAAFQNEKAAYDSFTISGGMRSTDYVYPIWVKEKRV